MPTEYVGTPPLTDRLRSADLILTGRFGRLVREQEADWGDPPKSLGIFDVTPDDVLFGDLAGDTLQLRVLGNRRADRIDWLVPITEETRFLFILVKDTLPDETGDIYAPSWLGVYPLDDDDRFAIPAQEIDDLARVALASDEAGRIPLSGLRQLMETLERERQEQAQRVDELARTSGGATGYPTVKELPPEPESAGRPGVIGRPPG
jgi:hypothetical protein